MQEISEIQQHFLELLQRNNCSSDDILQEWSTLKTYVQPIYNSNKKEKYFKFGNKFLQTRVLWLNVKIFFISSSCCLLCHFLTLSWSASFHKCLELRTTGETGWGVIEWKPFSEFLKRVPALKNGGQKQQLTFGMMQKYSDLPLGHTATLKKEKHETLPAKM